MLNNIALLAAIFLAFCAKAQDIYKLSEFRYEGDLPVKVQPIASDSLASSFIIWISSEVKAHFHAEHTEYVVVLEGSGEMILGDSSRTVKPGDLIYIPSETLHSVQVNADTQMKVLSIQSPEFKGKDRIFLRRPRQK